MKVSAEFTVLLLESLGVSPDMSIASILSSHANPIS
jgi:hypothetical protein